MKVIQLDEEVKKSFVSFICFYLDKTSNLVFARNFKSPNYKDNPSWLAMTIYA